MSINNRIDEAFEIGVRLPAKDRIQLIDRLVLSLERDVEVAKSSEPPPTEHWGKMMVRLIDELGPIEMTHPEITDPVEWVEQIRREQVIRRAVWIGDRMNDDRRCR